MSKQKPFSLNPATRLAFKHPPLYLATARDQSPEGMRKLFGGLSASGRDTLSDLSMSPRGQRLVIEFLQGEYRRKEQLLKRHVAVICAKRPHIHKY
jgi:hypothetical protein